MSVQFGFLFLDKKHFVDQAFKFPTTFLQYSELFSEVFVLLIVRVTQVFPVAECLCSSMRWKSTQLLENDERVTETSFKIFIVDFYS